MGISLDRFSQPLSIEFNRNVDDQDYFEVVEEKKCCGCGWELDPQEDQIQSEIYEDDWMHKDLECVQKYYKNQKDLLAANKKIG